MEIAYAQALWRLVEKGMKPTEAIAAIKKNLEAKGRLVLLPKIARAFARLAARWERQSTMTLTVARAKDMRKALEQTKKILVEQNIGDTDLCESTDETLIGGWRLEGRGLLVDASWKKSLLAIYNRATQ